VIEWFNLIGYIGPNGFYHNSMNLTHIGHDSSYPAVTILLFTLLYSLQYVCSSSKLRNRHIIGVSKFDFPHEVKTWLFKWS